MKNKEFTIYLMHPIPLLLFILFFGAKIFGKIDWSWWWVFSPLWVPTAIALVTCIIIFILKLIVFIYDSKRYSHW